MTNDAKYNGWTNWETWVTNLHFDDVFSENAQQCYDDAEADDICTREEKDALALSEVIKATVEELATESRDYGRAPFFTDILNGFLSSVNYYEIAKHYIEEVEKETA